MGLNINYLIKKKQDMKDNFEHTKCKDFPISRVHCIFNQGVNSAHCKGTSELVLLAASAKIYCSEVEIIRHKHGKKGLSTVQGFFSLSTGANFIFFCCNHAFNLASSTFS